MMEKIPVIIDTDPGSDDIFAIFLANSSSRLDIRGLSVVAGNMKAELTFENGLAINEFAGGGLGNLTSQALQAAP